MAEPSLEDPAIPARALLPKDQGRPHGNCVGASIHWTSRARGDEPARKTLWHPGQYEALSKSEPRHQPSRPETRPNQRLYVPLGSPPLVAVGSSSARAAHRSRAPKPDGLRMTSIAAGVKPRRSGYLKMLSIRLAYRQRVLSSSGALTQDPEPFGLETS
jgi:hypothetical protein